jgi:hypothetical protein
MQDPLLDAHIRNARYWNVDGLTEIAIGLQVLLVPLHLYGVTQTSRGSLGRVLAVLVLVVGLPAAMFLSGRVVVAVRRRFTYPRTGFVEYRQDRRPWVFGIGLALALLLVLLALRSTTANWVAWLFVFHGVVPGALTVYFGRLVRLVRLQVVGAIWAVWGLAIALAGLGVVQGMTIFWLGISALYLLSGSMTLWRYVRAHPVPAEAQ